MNETYKKTGVITETSTTAEIGNAEGKDITITEYANTYETLPSNEFTVSMTKWDPTADKQSISIDVAGVAVGAAGYSAGSSADWCTPTIESNEKVYISVTENSSSTARTANVAVGAGETSETIIVTQAGVQYGFLQPDHVDINKTAGSYAKLKLVGTGRWTTNHDHSLVRIVKPANPGTPGYSAAEDMFSGYSGYAVCEDGNLYQDGQKRTDGQFEQEIAVMAMHDLVNAGTEESPAWTPSYSTVRFINGFEEHDLSIKQYSFS